MEARPDSQVGGSPGQQPGTRGDPEFRGPQRSRIRRALRAAGSLRWTVVLLALAMLLVFLGTLAQARLGVWEVVDSYFRSPVAWIEASAVLPRAGALSGLRVPLPGGMTLGLLLFVNLLSAHFVRWSAVRRRPGVLVVHAGLVVLLAGEFAAGMLADEGMMRIDEGGAARHIEDVRRIELVVVDFSDPARDIVVRVPGSMVARAGQGGVIREARLPVEIEVVQWLDNARLFRGEGDARATAGVGLEAFPRSAPREAGAGGAGADMPAAYVTLRRGGTTLGTWLLWAGLDELQGVSIDGATYGVGLRYARTYLPFEVHLLDFSHEFFIGTSIPRDFSSIVRVVDPDRGVDREARIWMNNPLRYRGLAFYQSSYKPDGSGTVLQVVENPGWLLPYIACGMVGLGLAWQFAGSLRSFLQRQRAPGARVAAGASRGVRAGPWGAIAGVGLGGLIAAAGLLRPDPLASSPDGEAIRTFAALPVSSGGRVKPMDTAARNLLMAVGGRSSIRTEQGDVGATRFLLDLVARPEAVADLPVIRVDEPGVLSLLGRTPAEGGRLSLSVIEPHWREVADQAARAQATPSAARDTFDRAIVQLHDRVNLLLAHAQMREPYLVAPLGDGREWRSFHEAFLDERARAAGPPSSPGSPGIAVQPHPSVAFLAAMMAAYSEGDLQEFARAVRSYDELVARDLSGARWRARTEVLFNRASPLAGAMAMYVLGGLAVLASFLLRMLGDARAVLAARACRSGAIGLIVVAAVVHSLALAMRMFLQERPPVTNLYSSAVFVGWAAVLTGLLVERWLPLGLAALGASTIGFSTLVVAHNLGNDGDTMQMMQAVLDSNFWLATHVVTITLGYSATFLAGTLGATQILLGLSPRSAAPARTRTLSRAIYGVVCFALLLSFIGTVLGGIWADQSWGRFWGWDPKENGAALIVLLHAIIVHARWGGLVRDRGLAALAVAGNIVTAWSWFGTNMLGVGLHSYGFMDSAAFWLAAFVASQVVLMAASAHGRMPSGHLDSRSQDVDKAQGS